MKYKNCRVAKLIAPEKMIVAREDLYECQRLKKDEVVIRVQYVGICGSDIHFFSADKCERLPYPIELGHECAGIVEAVGEDVKHLQVGDRVAVEPGKECGKCKYCKAGKYNLCTEMDFMASPPAFHGACKEYVKHPANRCFRLPDQISSMEGALLEPMSVGFYAAERGRIAPNEKVLVVGAGCIGLMALMGCISAGASEVYIADILPNRLEIAKELGAARIIDLRNENALNDLEVDAVIECSGAAQAIETSLKVLNSGGRLVMVGCSLKPVPVEFAQFCVKEIEIIPIYRYRNMYPKLIKLLETKEIDLGVLVSGIYSLEDVQQAFHDAYAKKDVVIKNIVRIAK